MMRIKLICIGKIKENYLADGIRDFAGQIGKNVILEIIELPDEKTPQGASLVMENKIREIEGDKILQKIDPKDHVFALCIEGRQLSTAQLKKRMKSLKEQGVESLVFIIGGSLGLSPNVIRRAKDKISFSAMTFPHQLMRLILLEQLSKVLPNLR